MLREKILTFIDEYQETLTTIFSVDFCVKKMKDLGFTLDPEEDKLTSGKKTVMIESNSGYKGEKGYAIGKLLWGMDCLLNDKEYPEMKASFPSSVAYMGEVYDKSKDAITSILNNLDGDEAYYPYTLNEGTGWVFSSPEPCIICGSKHERLINSCHHGKFDSILVCKECYETKKDMIKALVEEKRARYVKEGERLLELFKGGGSIAGTAYPCCETSGSIYRKIRDLNLDFQYSMKLRKDDVYITFDIKSFEDFREKWSKINKATTECGCAVMYGDGGGTDVAVFNKNENTWSDINFEVLHYFTNAYQE